MTEEKKAIKQVVRGLKRLGDLGYVYIAACLMKDHCVVNGDGGETQYKKCARVTAQNEEMANKNTFVALYEE